MVVCFVLTPAWFVMTVMHVCAFYFEFALDIIPSDDSSHLISHLSPLTLEVVGAPQMTFQQYISILPCLPLPSGNLQTTFPSTPWYYLAISSSVFLSFVLLLLSHAELSSPCQRILRCGHTIWVSVSLPWLGSSSCTPIAFWILLRTSSFVTWSL